MITIRETRDNMLRDKDHAMLHLMEFVDDFRRAPDLQALATPFTSAGNPLEALLAATAEELCKEAGLSPPNWIIEMPGLKTPWFVSGLENLKAIAIVESPVAFRRRKIFVLENFLARA